MAYTTYLLKAGGTEIPISYIQTDSYEITPNQRLESSAERNTTGLLIRSTLTHTASKIIFSTKPLNETQKTALMSIITGAYTDVNARKLSLDYYCPDTGTYKTSDVYVPDIKFRINRIINNVVFYDPIQITFIEY